MTDSICELRHRSLHGDRAVRTVNRTESTKGEDDPVYYCTNQLKQYDFTAAAAPPCSTQPADVFEHDEDGTLIAAPLGETPTAHTLEWDAENRLKAAYPTTPEAGSKKVEYTYDYMNRRVERIVTNWDPELGENGDWGDVSQDTKYVYHGWNVILELNALSSNAITKKYTWGLDLAGLNGAVNSLDQAGGIGGSLACLDTGGTPSTGDDRTFVYCHDANGNVTQLVETTTGGNYGTLAAAYEYDAYGNAIVASFDYAPDNLIRFSTRPVDPLTLLGHWPMRVNDFERGRWASRDPIGEADSWNRYTLVRNVPTSLIDPDGQFLWVIPLALRTAVQIAVTCSPELAGGAACGGLCAFSAVLLTEPEPAIVFGQPEQAVYPPGYEPNKCLLLLNSYHRECNQPRSCEDIKVEDYSNHPLYTIDPTPAYCTELHRRFYVNWQCARLRLQFQRECVPVNNPREWTLNHWTHIRDAFKTASKCLDKLFSCDCREEWEKLPEGVLRRFNDDSWDQWGSQPIGW